MSGKGVRKLFPRQKLNAEESMTVFRRNRARRGVDWTQVDPDLLRGALMAACAAGHMVAFSSASGGVGVKLTIWADGGKEYEVAIEAEELHELLEQMIDAFQSPSEDIRLMFAVEVREVASAAD